MWNKLREPLREKMEELGFSQLNELQSEALEKFRAGKQLVIEASEGSGKSFFGALSLVQKIEVPTEGSPRGIMICLSDEEARATHAFLLPIAKAFDLTVDLVTEKGNKLQQRNDLFDGTEIIIGTPKRLHELYIQNGFNVGKISVFVVDDFDQQMKKGLNMQISRLAESLPKCQHIYLTNSVSDARVQQYLESVVPHAQVVEER